MSKHKVHQHSFSNYTISKKSSPLIQTRPWTNPYQQKNDQIIGKPAYIANPPTTQEWQKNNVLQRVIETRQAQLQQQAIQAKLTVGEPGDKYELEADAMASKVMSMSEPAVQKESEQKLQTKPLAQRVTPVVQLTAARNGSIQAKSNLESRLNSSKGGGSPLSNQVRSFMEPRFGADFSQVRVHTDSTAVQMSQELGAQAFTHGSDIYYGEGKAPGNNELTAHELTHVVQQTSNKISLQRKAGENLLPKGKNIHTLGIVSHEEGVNLRNNQSIVLRKLPFNTKLFIDQELPNGSYFVTLTTGEYGYVATSHVKKNLPEPDARLHKIKAGESAIGIAEKYYKANAQSWGEDLRFYVNVLEFVNRGQGQRGIYKANSQDSWKNTQTRDGYLIWIPSVNFAKTLKGQVKSGSITNEIWNGIKNAAVATGNFLVGGGAFIAGLLHGALESVWNTLVGLKDLAVMVWDVLKSLFSGEILSDAQNLWNQISNLNVSELIENWISNFQKKWNDESLLKRWHFRGWVIGYAIAEIAMLFFSGGTINGVKWTGKMTKIVKVVEKLPGVKRLTNLIKKSKSLQKIKTALNKRITRTASKVPTKIKKLYKVSSEMREKILWGKQKGKELIGGHFRGLIGHPDYVAEIVGVSAKNPGCIRVKFIKKLPNGSLSKIKSPASTLFPKGWSKNDIIKAIEDIANNPQVSWSRIQDKATIMQGQVKGVHIEVIVDSTGKISAGYPL